MADFSFSSVTWRRLVWAVLAGLVLVVALVWLLADATEVMGQVMGQADVPAENLAAESDTASRAWGWVKLSAFSLFGFAVFLNVVGYVVEYRQRDAGQAGVKATAQARVAELLLKPGRSLARAGGAQTKYAGSARIGVRQAKAAARANRPTQLAFGDLPGGARHRLRLVVLDAAVLFPGQLNGADGDTGGDADANGGDADSSAQRAAQVITELQQQGLQVAGIQAGEQTQLEQLAQQCELDQPVVWLASSQAGAPIDSVTFAEVLRRLVNVPYRHWLVVSPDPASLETAQSLGCETLQFDPSQPVSSKSSRAGSSGAAAGPTADFAPASVQSKLLELLEPLRQPPPAKLKSAAKSVA